MTVVVFDETGEERQTTGVCATCVRAAKACLLPAPTEDEPTLVSPTGMVHVQHDYISENTLCGKNATGDGWWWQA